MSERVRVWPVLLASTIGIAILCLLGVWQVQRLAWKNGVIATIDQRLKDQPVSLGEALLINESGADANYLVAEAEGKFLGTEIRKLTSHLGQPGFSIIAPFLSSDGIVVLVDVGTVPENMADPASRSAALPQQVKGYLKRHDQGQGLFDAENNPAANQWYWWDVPAMLGAVSVPPEAKILELVLHRLPEATETTPPIAPAPKAELRNNHLGYAITWFGLAAALAVVTAMFLRRGLKRNPA